MNREDMIDRKDEEISHLKTKNEGIFEAISLLIDNFSTWDVLRRLKEIRKSMT